MKKTNFRKVYSQTNITDSTVNIYQKLGELGFGVLTIAWLITKVELKFYFSVDEPSVADENKTWFEFTPYVNSGSTPILDSETTGSRTIHENVSSWGTIKIQVSKTDSNNSADIWIGLGE